MTDAVVIGSAGQDGRLLVERLRAERKTVVGVSRDSGPNIEDAAAVQEFVRVVQPKRVFFLAAFHHSAEDAVDADPAGLLNQSFAIHTHAWTNVLEACRRHAASCRLFYASSSHVFGNPKTPVQNEATPLDPVNIYGISKVAGMHVGRFYRSRLGMHVSAGILYNHESPYRAPKFLSQRIVRGALAALAGKREGRTETLTLGNLSATVDWGYAPDYIDAMVRITERDTPDDYVVATGKAHTVQQFAEAAFSQLGLNWKEHVQEMPGIVRKESVTLVGDASRLRDATGWAPTVTFEQMIGTLLGAAR